MEYVSVEWQKHSSTEPYSRQQFLTTNILYSSHFHYLTRILTKVYNFSRTVLPARRNTVSSGKVRQWSMWPENVSSFDNHISIITA
jgi:hypothetical protein